MTSRRSAVLMALLVCGFTTATPTDAQIAADTSVRELPRRLNALQRGLHDLESASDSASRERLMRRNWQEMQGYLGWIHERWGVGAPWMMGHRGGGGCCPMMHGAAGATWPLPPRTDAARYRQQTGDLLQQMHRQVDSIVRATDGQQQRRLLLEHWQTVYQRMQFMRGMGWMWAGPMRHGMMWRPMPDAGTAKPLPEPGSQGATLVATYCTQCHAAPSPSLHTASEWNNIAIRMLGHMRVGVAGIKTPSEWQLQQIVAYMQKHAR